MSKIEGGNLLANLRPIGTAQPVSDPSKAKEAKEASSIQPADTQPILVKEENAFDGLEKSYDGGEIDKEAIEKLQKKYKEGTSVKKAEVDDATTYKAGENQAGNVIVGDRVAQSDTSVYAAPELVRTVGTLTANMVEDTVTTTSTPEKTVEHKLAHDASPVETDVIVEHKREMQIEADPEVIEDTDFIQFQADPIHRKSGYEVAKIMKDYESPILHPEQEPVIYKKPEEYEAPVASENHSLHLPTNEKTIDEVQRDERWAEGVKETLLYEARVQSDAITEPKLSEAAESQAQTAAAPLVSGAQPQSEPTQAVESTSPQVEEVSTTQAVSTVDETLPEVRPELQSTVSAANQQANTAQETAKPVELDLPEYEMPELDLPEYQPVEVDTTNTQAQVSETAEYEPQILGADNAEEDFFPPLPGQGGDSVEESADLEDYFPPLPGNAEASSSEQSIRTANEGAVVKEAIQRATQSEPQTIEVETEAPESSNVQVMSDEELNWLRASAMNHNVETTEVKVEPRFEVPERPVQSEEWVSDAINFNTSERYSTSIGTDEMDLTEFEEKYVKQEEPTRLEDYDYTLVANRISEAAATIAPQELLNTYGS